MKTHSAFFNEDIIASIRSNIKTNKAAKEMAADFISNSSYWMNLTYSELRGLIFTPELKRSWFVRSDGFCPSCGESVPMYNWKFNPTMTPWKMQCPHCSGLFPKNDFETYYKSGLDENNDFRHNLADRSLLVNSEGTDFGVDDGNGWYDENGIRYMFIGAYLSHAQWSKLVIEGITNLAFSYILTNNLEYARRAGIILDSITRHFPDYDFFTQGVMYEQEYKSKGYVNYWVNSNHDIRKFALSYDQIYNALKDDQNFIKLVDKSFNQFCENVESRIFYDAFNNMGKINTNPPETPLTVIIVKSVLNYSQKEIYKDVDGLIRDATRVDGLSGESGLAGYAAITPRALADMLCFLSNIKENIIDELFEKHPVLYKTYRFHIDTWYNASYYPGIGDNSIFSLPMKQYTGLFSVHAPIASIYHRSREWFALKLSKFYKDPDFAKAIYLSHDKSVKGVFSKDYYIGDPKSFENEVHRILHEHGNEINQSSINYYQWRISLLHTGENKNKYLLAIPYDTGSNHCHHDALSLHIFAKGINVTPDFGYPPVNYGGWKTKEALWYRHPATHNQVVVDGKLFTNIPPDGDGMFYRFPEFGNNLMFSTGSFVNATYNDSKEYADIKRYERLVAIVDISESDCYCIDISRTEGGTSHSKFIRSSYSTISTTGLDLAPGKEYYPNETIMRNYMSDQKPKFSWSVDFDIAADELLTPLENNIHLKYTSLTADSEVSTCESWVDITRMTQTSDVRTGNKVVWIPTVFETLADPKTQFSGIYEVYENSSNILKIERPDISLNKFDEAIKITHVDGTYDIIIANDPNNNHSIELFENHIKTDALLAIIRYKNNILLKATICTGTFLKLKDAYYTADTNKTIIEFL